ncbi:hypothetical protein PAECIP111892_05243 [Paenibacillus auburnensis]|uniref:ATP-binding protein n=1 Tax=Paenibacillus auburnensis TaxID=2905649 RepID=A0ABN8GZU9_9BACL|nr:hypothetical protein [Paenibacillus auburnensis]CAH1222947.1 hypothetical protein PAECIP111892_05243 [Paenibacillus auburnensis]
MAFKSSINIKFDLGNAELITRYIPTPSHAEAMKGIINGFTTDTNRAHIIVGPYGTGKSLLANVVGSIVSKMASPYDIDSLAGKFEQVDEQIASKIKDISNLPIPYLPILLSGNEGRFRHSILSGILKKLKEKGIDVVLPGLSTKIIKSVETWNQEFPDTYQKFCLKLKQDGRNPNNWIEEIKKQNEAEIKYFSTIYPFLTAGATFDIDYDYSFLSQMEYLANVLQDNNLGVFIIYDEFARFLQGLNPAKFNEAMQDIQDLAELSNRMSSIHMLLITHKSLRYYFSSSNDDVAKEFQRIEKRFNQYLVKSDQVTFLRIAEIILTENINQKPIISTAEFNSTREMLRKYPLFPSINQTERDELVVRGMFPLHPVAIFLLPNLTRVFGQNERTLFTFLESQETGGLLNHINKTNDYYLAHQLFNFFFPDSYDVGNDDFSEHILLYKKAMARLPEGFLNKNSAMNLVKIITLWNLCAVQNEQKLNTEFLEFATQISKDELSEILQLLSKHKVIRFNRVNDYWELFAGNSVDLQEKLDHEKQLLKIDSAKEIEVLHNNLAKKFYFPERYNDDKGMTRFSAVRIVYGRDIIEGKWNREQQAYDLIMYYVLANDQEMYESLDFILQELSIGSDRELFFLHPKPVSEVSTEVYNYIGLDLLRKNKTLLSEDKGIKEELEVLINETKYRISLYLSDIASFNEGRKWYISGNGVTITSEFELTEILSEKCYELYSCTPVILNDTFNRNVVSGVQRNAAIQLIDKIIDDPRKPHFGVTGNGPDYALFAAIFKNNDSFDMNVNNLDYSNIINGSFSALRSKLIEVLESNPTGNFKDITKLFIAPPFGIRKPLIPILFVALIRDRWNEFMLYRNDMFVPGINGAKLFEIIVETGAENYQYAYEHINDNYVEFFNIIEKYFIDSLETRLSNQSRLIFICGTLLKWFRSLPRIAQTSVNVDEEFKEYRDLIKRSEVDPQQSIAKLLVLYQHNTDRLLAIKQYAEEFTKLLKKELAKKMLQVLGVSNFIDIKNWVEIQRSKGSYLINKLPERIYNSLSNENEEIWIEQFSEKYVGVKVEDWSDTTYDLFFTQLSHDLEELTLTEREIKQSNLNVVSIQINNSRKLISKVDLSVKSETIYSNLERMVNIAGKNVPRQELEYLIYQLFENYVVKPE